MGETHVAPRRVIEGGRLRARDIGSFELPGLVEVLNHARSGGGATSARCAAASRLSAAPGLGIARLPASATLTSGASSTPTARHPTTASGRKPSLAAGQSTATAATTSPRTSCATRAPAGYHPPTALRGSSALASTSTAPGLPTGLARSAARSSRAIA